MKHKSFEFFMEHAGYSYNPKTQSAYAGRVSCATDLARAAVVAWDEGCTFDWVPDVHGHDGAGEFDAPDQTYWVCLMRDEGGSVIDSLGGIGFADNAEPWGQPYASVVEAELALEQFEECL